MAKNIFAKKSQNAQFETKLGMVSVAQLVARRTNNRKVVSSIPDNAVCVSQLQVTAWGKLSAVAGHRRERLASTLAFDERHTCTAHEMDCYFSCK